MRWRTLPQFDGIKKAGCGDFGTRVGFAQSLAGVLLRPSVMHQRRFPVTEKQRAPRYREPPVISRVGSR